MPFVKGKAKTGGRKPGSKSRFDRTVHEKAEQLDIDPFEVLLLFAKGDWQALGYESKEKIVAYSKEGGPIYSDIIKPEARIHAAGEAVQYLFPKQKSIQHSGPNGSPISFEGVTEEELIKKAKELMGL